MNNILTNIKRSLSHNAINIPGWRTNRKIVVIESDDWGSIRMPSMEIFNKFVSQGFDIIKSEYNRLDTLESNDDLQYLFEVLSAIRDKNDNPAVITANIVTGNPDFKRIRESDFTQYYVEPVAETLKRYRGRDSVEVLWKQGNRAGIFHPQFHGREHVNVIRWMNALGRRTPEIMATFDCETTFSGEGDYNFMEVLDYNTPADLVLMKESLREGLQMFQDMFGYKSESFIPPCYTWNSDIEETLSVQGVRFIQGLVVQSVPTGSFGNYTRKIHFTGNKNEYGQIFLVRNCFFEPTISQTSDPSGECLRRIRIAFRWHKPAIISAHRINFMGALNEENRRKNLSLLKDLLTRIMTIWPDVEFMTSDQLGRLIASDVRL